MITPDQSSADFAALPELPEGVFTAPLKRPAHVAENWLEPAQRVYTAAEHRIWDDLYARQMDLVPHRAATPFLQALDLLELGKGGVPDFSELSERLEALTGWMVVPVPMLIPDHVFFWHLANRRFPAGNFIRSRDQFDYIEEPDVFHDIFGHVPMLTDPVFAHYMQAYGQAGWQALRHNRLKALGALYWYTVEFGLVLEAGNLRAYGAGILSGPKEIVFALEARSPNRVFLNVDRVMRTDYVIDDLQPTYFVVEDFETLYHHTAGRDFELLYRKLGPGFTYANTALLDLDHVLTEGTQEYHLRGGRLSGAKPV